LRRKVDIELQLRKQEEPASLSAPGLSTYEEVISDGKDTLSSVGNPHVTLFQHLAGTSPSGFLVNIGTYASVPTGRILFESEGAGVY
jgi:hypothetical protein